MSDQNASLVLHDALEDSREDFLAHISVQRRDGVIHQDDVTVVVNGASQRESCLLSSRESDTSLSYLSPVTSREELQVRLKLACIDRLNILAFLELTAKQNVLTHA